MKKNVMANAAVSANRHLIYACNDETGCFAVYSDASAEHLETKVRELLNEICLHHGSSIEGRASSFRFLMGNVYKACILLDERSEQMMIPLASLQNKDAAIILYNDIASLEQEGSKTIVHMKNGMDFETGLSLKSLRIQIHRCEEFLMKIDER